jgi:2-keto-4-pentenoate hydratase/2-oxohepta-3-ene-1,7-dioic acid hydratase in catechol pathway
MKIVRFETGGTIHYGVLEDNGISPIEGDPFQEDAEITDMKYALASCRLLAPCEPSKIVAYGVNYKSHSDEMGSNLPDEPLMFIKPTTSVIGPDQEIVYPPSSKRVDYEGELGVVIGDIARSVSPEDALDYVFGYTCLNDVTARDLQQKDGQWTRGKGFDTFCPFGPWIETDLSPEKLHLQTRLNGEVKQDTDTSSMIFPVDVLISFASRVMTLLPGDVIATGTAAGVGPMQPGDVVEVEIGGIGILRNTVVKE